MRVCLVVDDEDKSTHVLVSLDVSRRAPFKGDEKTDPSQLLGQFQKGPIDPLSKLTAQDLKDVRFAVFMTPRPLVSDPTLLSSTETR